MLADNMLFSSCILPCFKVRKSALVAVGFSVLLMTLATMPLGVIIGLASGLIMHPASWGPGVAWASCNVIKCLSSAGLLSSDMSHTDLAEENALLRRQLEEATARARSNLGCFDGAESSCTECAQVQDGCSEGTSISENVQTCKQFAKLGPAAEEPALPSACLYYLHASPRVLGDTVLPQLRIEEELSEIQDALGPSVAMAASVATVTSLRKAAGTPGVWLHLSAHCIRSSSGESALVLEDGPGLAARALWQHDLDSILRAGDGCRAEFVFLASCSSTGFAKSFQAAGVRHVIYCSMPVRDSAARRFGTTLYHQLAQQKTLRHAFEIALETARLNDDGVCYCLLSDDSETCCLPRTVVRAPSECVPLSSSKLASSLPRLVQDFVGRLAVIDELLRTLASRRVVSLHCDGPLGRTATLTQVAHYLNLPGRAFAGRIAFFPQSSHGGLLVVDDADDVLTEEWSRRLLQRHLRVEGAALLLGCRCRPVDPFEGAEKVLHVRLPPLSAEESTELFLRFCSRPLVVADFEDAETESERPLLRKEATARLRAVVPQLAGEPGRIRRAAAATTARPLRLAMAAGDLGFSGPSRSCNVARPTV